MFPFGILAIERIFDKGPLGTKLRIDFMQIRRTQFALVPRRTSMREG